MFLRQQKSETNSNSQQILLADPSFFLFLFFISIFSLLPLVIVAPLYLLLFLSMSSSRFSLSLTLILTKSSSSSSFSLIPCYTGVATADKSAQSLAVFYAGCPSCCNLLVVGNIARPFNVLGCTLEGNQLRHCIAKLIVQLAIIASTSGFLHQACFDPGTNRVWVGHTTHWATGAHSF